MFRVLPLGGDGAWWEVLGCGMGCTLEGTVELSSLFPACCEVSSLLLMLGCTTLPQAQKQQDWLAIEDLLISSKTVSQNVPPLSGN